MGRAPVRTASRPRARLPERESGPCVVTAPSLSPLLPPSRAQFFAAWAETSTPLRELVPTLLANIKPAYVGDHAVAM